MVLFDEVPMPKTNKPVADAWPVGDTLGRLITTPLLFELSAATGLATCDAKGTAVEVQGSEEHM